MRHATRVISLATLLLLGACASTPAAPMTQHFTLVQLKTGPMSGKLSKEENEKAFAGHFSNMGKLAEEHKLLLAGPYGSERHDKALRGIFVLNTGDRAEAMAWASTDPTTQAGVFVLEYHDFATNAPLVAMQQRTLAQRKQAEAEGRTLKPGDGARPYVLLVAKDGPAARRELTHMLNDRGVCLLAELDDGSVLAVLDAKDAADARARNRDMLARIGPHTLDDWFATDQLAKLPPS